jgi:hypothetical protein
MNKLYANDMVPIHDKEIRQHIQYVEEKIKKIQSSEKLNEALAIEEKIILREVR